MKTSFILGAILVLAITAQADNNGYKNAKWGSSPSQVESANGVRLEKSDSGRFLDDLFYQLLGVPFSYTIITPSGVGVFKFYGGVFPKESITDYKSGEEYYRFYKDRFTFCSMKLQYLGFSVYFKQLQDLYGASKAQTITQKDRENAAGLKTIYTVNNWQVGGTYIWLIKEEDSWYILGAAGIGGSTTSFYAVFASVDIYDELKRDIQNNISSFNNAGNNTGAKERKRHIWRNHRKIQ